jgi:hypothetical protein
MALLQSSPKQRVSLQSNLRHGEVSGVLGRTMDLILTLATEKESFANSSGLQAVLG